MKKKIAIISILLTTCFLFGLYAGNRKNSKSPATIIQFPELKLACVYGDCILQPPKGLFGTERCIVWDNNYGRIVINRVFFPCDEFMGKTVIWEGGQETMTARIVRVQHTY